MSDYKFKKIHFYDVSANFNVMCNNHLLKNNLTLLFCHFHTLWKFFFFIFLKYSMMPCKKDVVLKFIPINRDELSLMINIMFSSEWSFYNSDA
jgi:hypothetical protein